MTTSMTEHLLRAADALDREAETKENHANWLREELAKTEAEAAEARAGAAAIRQEHGPATPSA